MWTSRELGDLRLLSTALREGLELHQEIAAIRAVLANLDTLDEAAVVASMQRDLERSFRVYGRGRTPLAAIVWTWSGAEVEPFVPTDVWGSGFGGFDDSNEEHSLTLTEPVFRESGGFGFAPLDEWLVELATKPALEQLGVLEPAKKLVIARSLILAKRALENVAGGEAFRALPRKAPFAFFARPGHDQPAVRLS